MLATAIAWEVYERTNDPLALGFAGLARAIPVILFALPAGQAADIFNRKYILIASQALFAIVTALLALLSWFGAPVWSLYLALVATGLARAFNGPARASLLPQIVPPGDFHNAVTWNSGVFQFSAVTGPLLAGILIAAYGAAWPVYLGTALACLTFAVSAAFLRPRLEPRKHEPQGQPGRSLISRFSLRSMTAGAGHLWQEKTILAAIALDLFAVLLGGATALMPIYARDILHVGPVGLGALRAAPFIGAFVMALILAHRPPFRRSGPALLFSVVGFGLCTIVFGFSTWFPLSLAMLILLGALDNISVVIRHVLVQVRTPDHIRGRVSAVNSVFIESSNELGAFESGLVAKLFGPVASVVSGGIGTILVVIGIAWWLPEIRRLGRLEEPR
jgi:MFS family permease